LYQALSPLFTVAAYALLFGVKYSNKTYTSLLPLTLGVMLACSFAVSASDIIGLLCAFGSALVFVSSNIFFKKIMPSSSSGHSGSSHKLDKLNLLLYSSGMAFLLMIPLWMYYDLPLLVAARANPHHISHPKQGHSAPHSVVYYFFMNGTVHFAQNIIAFVILSSTSPVTYSIASLIKRVAVICIAIVWFNQTIHPIQAIGIALTFSGLYMYNNAKDDVEKGEKKITRVQAARDMMLPTTKSESHLLSDTETPPHEYPQAFAYPDPRPTVTGIPNNSAYARPRGMSIHTSGSNAHRSNQKHHRMTPLPVSPASTFTSHMPPNANPTKPPPKRESISLRIVSPVDPYPSPPPSLDSPTSHTIPLSEAFLHAPDLGQRVKPVMA
jgi:solute carrier family 35 protein E1